MKAKETAQKWSSEINKVTIGGGKRKEATVGGAKCISWMAYEGEIGNRPLIALDVWDTQPAAWPEALKNEYGGCLADPAAWAKRAAELKADLVCLRLAGTHPDGGNKSPDDAADCVKKVLAATDLPLIVWGCGIEEKDNAVMPRVSEVSKGENCLLGTITDKNYRTLVAACLADGHKLIAESPLDINIAKQINILAHDAGYPLENIVIYPTSAAMGYGFDYVYSIMERARIAGLGGDPLMKPPILVDVGAEAWRAKEAQASDELLPGHGPASERGPLWEILTATNYLQAGADLLVLRHPKAVEQVRAAIDRLVAGAKALAGAG